MNQAETAGAWPTDHWSEGLISDSVRTLPLELTRAFSGLALAAVYGLAIGARDGGAALPAHAIGVPLGFLAVCGIGVPSLFVFLAMFRVPVSPMGAVRAASRALATAGLILAGLAPAALLFALTSSSDMAAGVTGMLGLLTAGGLALVRLVRDLMRDFHDAPMVSKAWAPFALAGFALFGVVLAVRIWMHTLPMLGGGA